MTDRANGKVVQQMAQDVVDVFTQRKYEQASNWDVLSAVCYALATAATEMQMPLNEYMNLCRAAYQSLQQIRGKAPKT